MSVLMISISRKYCMFAYKDVQVYPDCMMLLKYCMVIYWVKLRECKRDNFGPAPVLGF